MDLNFENLPDYICDNCRFDIKFKTGNETVLQEFKSYALSTWNSIFNKPAFLKQFKSYLATSDVNTIADFQYIINSRKASVDQVKDAFKELLKQKAPKIYNSRPSIFNQFDRLDGGKIEDLEDFVDLVNHNSFNSNHPMFDFIIKE